MEHDPAWGSLVLGVATGLLWAPCAGPVLGLILTALDPPDDSPVLKSVLRGWIAMVETMGRGWLRHGQPTRQELEILLPELLRAVLGAAAWHDAATAAVLPRLPRGRAT